MLSMLKRPSAWLPIAMSSASLAMLLGFVAWHVLYAVPVVRDPDEGTAAHIFQILQTVQVPIGLFFAAKWIPRMPQTGASRRRPASARVDRPRCPGFLSGRVANHFAWSDFRVAVSKLEGMRRFGCVKP